MSDFDEPTFSDDLRGQGELFEMPRDVGQIVDDDDPRQGTIAERAERFHKRNPSVRNYIVETARYAKRRGMPHWGMKAIFEVMRFKYFETRGDIYKLNNNYTAFYARMVMEGEPDLAGFFTVRECPNDPEYRARETKS